MAHTIVSHNMVANVNNIARKIARNYHIIDMRCHTTSTQYENRTTALDIDRERERGRIGISIDDFLSKFKWTFDFWIGFNRSFRIWSLHQYSKRSSPIGFSDLLTVNNANETLSIFVNNGDVCRVCTAPGLCQQLIPIIHLRSDRLTVGRRKLLIVIFM